MSAPGGSRTTAQQLEPPTTELERFCFDRLDEAKRESVPISRHRLAEELAKKHSLRFKEAFEVVDQYCEERAPGTPDYLDREFLIPFLKLTGLVFAALALIAVVVTVIMFRPSDPRFLIGLGITILFGLLASAGYVRGLIREFGTDK